MKSWQGPFYPPPIVAHPDRDIFNQPVPANNRGAMCEGRNGQLHWVVAANAQATPRRTETHLLVSADHLWGAGGKTLYLEADLVHLAAADNELTARRRWSAITNSAAP